MPIKTTASMFPISKNIDIPGKPGRTKEKRFPLDQLDIGDSFFIPPNIMLETETFTNLRSHINGYAQTARISITTRIRSEDGIIGMRVWRVQVQDKVRK